MSDAKLNDIGRALQDLIRLFWGLQGRVNSIERVVLQNIEDMARIQPDPKAYMLRFAERARARESFGDVDNAVNMQPAIEQTREALDDFLIQVVTQAANVKK
jgi:hypothetical protein